MDEGWTIKKAEHGRIAAFELQCWIRLLRVLWTVRWLDQSFLKEINPEYSLEGLMLKLKLQDFGHLMKRADSLEKTLMLGKSEGRRRRGRQRMKWLDGIIDSMTWVWESFGNWWRTGKPGVMQSMGLQRVRHNWATELSWAELTRLIKKKREKNQINKIRNEKGEVTSDNAQKQRIIRDYYEQLYGNKIDNLEEMERLLENSIFQDWTRKK